MHKNILKTNAKNGSKCRRYTQVNRLLIGKRLALFEVQL